MESLDAAGLRRWCAAVVEVLGRAREDIDALNVYPVADRDTGTNLLLTMQAAVDELCGCGPDADVGELCRALAHGALMGARGNSGLILSQLLRGLAEQSVGQRKLDGAELASALGLAVERGYAAVAEPVEGTVLSVARAAADAARQASPPVLPKVLAAAVAAAATELARSPQKLAALARAGVVDAAGQGLLLMLQALSDLVEGRPNQRLDLATGRAAARVAGDQLLVSRPADQPADRETGSERYAYEVQYLLEAGEEAANGLRSALRGLGDSVVVAGGGGLFTVHAHVNDVGGALEAGLRAGRPCRVTVTRFDDQHARRPRQPPPAGRVVVVLAPGAGLAQLFRAGGARVVGARDTAAARTAVLAAGEAVLVSSDADARGVADTVAAQAREDGCRAAVVPARSPLQGLAALAVHDPDRPFGDDVVAMTYAAATTRTARVQVDEQQRVRGWVDGQVVSTGRQVHRVAEQLLDRLLAGGGELVTLVTGRPAADDLGARLAHRLHRSRPQLEVVVYRADHPDALLLGVE